MSRCETLSPCAPKQLARAPGRATSVKLVILGKPRKHPGLDELQEAHPGCVNMKGAWRVLHWYEEPIVPVSALQNCAFQIL